MAGAGSIFDVCSPLTDHPLNKGIYVFARCMPQWRSPAKLRDLARRNDLAVLNAVGTLRGARYRGECGAIDFTPGSGAGGGGLFDRKWPNLTVYTLMVRFRIHTLASSLGNQESLLNCDVDVDSNRIFQFRVDTDDKLQYIGFDNAGNPVSVSSSNALATNTDYIGIVTHDSSNTARLYVNRGVQDGSVGTGTAPTTSNNIRVARYGNANFTQNFLDGEVSCIRIWRRALTPGEVGAVIADELAGCPGTVHWLDDPSFTPAWLPPPIACKFMACASATFGTEFWTTLVGSVTIDSIVVRRGPRSWNLNTGAGAATASLTKSSVVSDAGGRFSAWVRFAQVTPAANSNIMVLTNAGAAGVVQVLLTTANKLQAQPVGGTSVTGTTVIQANVWYRICMTWRITTTTNFELRVYLWQDGSPAATLEATANAGTLTNTGAVNARIIANATAGANWVQNFDEVYVDDSPLLDDVGNVAVTAKLPAANATNQFDTAIGANPANRWTNVNERPVSLTNGWRQTGVGVSEESFGIQADHDPDFNIQGFQRLARMAWVWAKRDVPAVPLQASASNTGKVTGTTLTLGPITVKVGQAVVVTFGDQVAGTAPTIADNLSGTAWTARSGGTSTVRQSNWIKVADVAGSMTATVTFQSSSASRAGVIGAFHQNFASPLDVNPATNTDATTPFDSPLSGTLAQANEIVLGFRASAINTALVAGASDTLVLSANTTGGSAGTNTSVGMTYRVVTATTSIQPQMTGTSAAGVSGTASLKKSDGTGSPKLVHDGVNVAVVLTTSAAMYTDIDNTDLYSTVADVVGMVSSGDLDPTFLYECGVLFAYIETQQNFVPPNLATVFQDDQGGIINYAEVQLP